MVYIPFDEFETAYKNLRKEAIIGSSSVLIVVANDVDSLCASRILTVILNCMMADIIFIPIWKNLLKTDHISHKIISVSGYSDLTNLNDSIIKNSTNVSTCRIEEDVFSALVQLKTLFLLNCGGLINLSEYFTLNDDMKVYVMDAHRPTNLDNAFSSSQVCLFIFTLSIDVIFLDIYDGWWGFEWSWRS